MPTEPNFKQPRLLAVWPGMGNVAINAGIYLASKLDMSVLAEFAPGPIFDVEHVEVQRGIIRPARLPRSRVFSFRDPQTEHDLILFVGEAQPPTGKRAFCQALIEFAKRLGVIEVYTFAAMATQMHPEHRSRVFVAATNQEMLDQFIQFDVEILAEGQIGGLNGVLLGEASEAGLQGACLLGEIPHIFSQLPFPGASLAVLNVFSSLIGLKLDTAGMERQAVQFSARVGELLAQVEAKAARAREEEPGEFEPAEPPGASPEDERRIEELFEQAQDDRTKAYELKQELDRLGLFKQYEDRFLDLFKKPEA